MESTGGEPDAVGYDQETGEYIFYDCSAESPKGRRNVCYDREALGFGGKLGQQVMTGRQPVEAEQVARLQLVRTADFRRNPDLPVLSQCRLHRNSIGSLGTNAKSESFLKTF